MSGLQGIKAGDKIVCQEAHSSYEKLFTVESLTKTQAKCVGGAKFKIDTGLMIGTGGTWNSRYGRLADMATMKRIATNGRISAAREALKAFAITAENLEAVEAFLKASKP